MKEPQTCEIDDYFSQSDPFDTVIDVRSPAEFALDHIPGAINLPVLSDLERERVGTINAQASSFDANRMGASLISANIAKLLAGVLADKPRDWRVAVYCWRGGNRSGSLGTVLARVGWRTTVIAGGYQAYRRWVRAQMPELVQGLRFEVIAGRTGTGKSKILQAMAQLGAQTLDLEAIANHRGSVLGLMPDEAQPTQKMFDSLLAGELRALDRTRTVYVESESRKVGQVQLPGTLIESIRQSPCHVIDLPVAARVQFLCTDYAHFLKDPAYLKLQLSRLKDMHGKERIAQWDTWIDAGNFEELITDLLTRHYDPAYDRSMKRNFSQLDNAHTVGVAPIKLAELDDWFYKSAEQIYGAPTVASLPGEGRPRY